MMTDTESILVCGTGVVGLASALALSRAGFAVSLLGPRQVPPARAADDFHPRVFALSPNSQALLDHLGAWRLMDAARVTPVDSMEVYGDADGRLGLSAWQDVRRALAWIVEADQLERSLQQAVQVVGIPWLEDRFAALDRHPQGVEVHTAAGQHHRVALLVGADGAKSPVRGAARIEHRETPYGELGVVAHLNSELPHQNQALQWFTGSSVLALLPLPDTGDGPQRSMVWSLPIGQARQWMALDADAQQEFFAARVRAVVGERLGALQLRSRPLGFPLALARSAMTASGIALVGDAAHRVHPLAGQGLNLGLGDVRTLVQVLQARETYRGLGDARVLARYRRRRAEPVLAMGLVTDGLHRLFDTPCAPLAWARNSGMNLLDNVPFLKRRLIQAAAGD